MINDINPRIEWLYPASINEDDMEEELLFQGMDDMDYTNLLTNIPDDVQDSKTVDDEVAHAIDDYEDELEFIKEMEN